MSTSFYCCPGKRDAFYRLHRCRKPVEANSRFPRIFWCGGMNTDAFSLGVWQFGVYWNLLKIPIQNGWRNKSKVFDFCIFLGNSELTLYVSSTARSYCKMEFA